MAATTKTPVRVLGGRYKALLIESNCPQCGKPSSTDEGGGFIPENFVASFLCPTCNVEWGCDVRLDVSRVE